MSLRNWIEQKILCNHDYALIKKTAVYDYSWGKPDYPDHTRLTYQCTKCQTIKQEKI